MFGETHALWVINIMPLVLLRLRNMPNCQGLILRKTFLTSDLDQSLKQSMVTCNTSWQNSKRSVRTTDTLFQRRTKAPPSFWPGSLVLIKTSDSNGKPCPPPTGGPKSCFPSHRLCALHPQQVEFQNETHGFVTRIKTASGFPETIRDPRKMSSQTDLPASTPFKFNTSAWLGYPLWALISHWACHSYCSLASMTAPTGVTPLDDGPFGNFVTSLSITLYSPRTLDIFHLYSRR